MLRTKKERVVKLEETKKQTDTDKLDSLMGSTNECAATGIFYSATCNWLLIPWNDVKKDLFSSSHK